MSLACLVSRIPRTWIRFFGQLQFRVPWLSGPIGWAAALTTSADGMIQSGVGKGLKFRARGGYPGYLLGTSEPEEQALIGTLLRPGDVFYDVGANIGFYSTLAALLVGRSGRVFAFEPFPESAQSCRHNAALNDFDQVTVIEAAVDEQNGSAQLELNDSTATHHLGTGAGVAVNVVSIDSWRDSTGNPAPRLVLIDVEGAEIRVLRGMLETIRSSRPTLMVEVHWLGESFLNFFRETLEPLGYRATTYEGKPLPASPVRYHALLRPQ